MHIYGSTSGISPTLNLENSVTSYGGSDDGPSITFKTRWTGNSATYDQARIRGIDDNLGGYGSGAGGLAIDTTYNASFGERMRISSNGNVGIGTTAPTATLEVSGSIKSPMWRAIQLFNATPGGLPLTSSSFTTGGGTLLIFASGAGYATTPQQIGMAIAVDSVTKGYAKTFTNETSSHKAFAANALLVSGIAADSHTITLSAWNGTITNPDDFFSVTVLELPF